MSLSNPKNGTEKTFNVVSIFLGFLIAIFFAGGLKTDYNLFVEILISMVPGFLLLIASLVLLRLLREMINEFKATKVMRGLYLLVLMVSFITVCAVGWPLITATIQADIGDGFSKLAAFKDMGWIEVTASLGAFIAAMLYHYRTPLP